MTLFIGNLNAKRDWGHARDYVDGIWLIVQQDEPDDYVLATGEGHSVRQFVKKAFAHFGRTIVSKGSGIEEKGFDQASGKILVEVDPRYFRKGFDQDSGKILWRSTRDIFALQKWKA